MTPSILQLHQARHDFLKNPKKTMFGWLLGLKKDFYKNRDAVRNTEELMPQFTWNEEGTEGEQQEIEDLSYVISGPSVGDFFIS